MWCTVELILEKWCVVDAGGSLYKGLNRATATLSAGSVAFGIHWLAIKSGRTADHIILGASVFLLCKRTHSNLGLLIASTTPHSLAGSLLPQLLLRRSPSSSPPSKPGSTTASPYLFSPSIWSRCRAIA